MRTIRIITALALCALFCAPIYAQKYTVRNSGNYEVVTLGVGADGTKIFKIYFAPGGQYLRYVNVTSSENPSKEKVKGGFKFGLEVQVLYNNLRNDLQDAGVIRSLSSGF